LATDQQNTAQTIWAELRAGGFSAGAAAGILGNAQAESGIIADRWEGDRTGNLAGGYGLLQWTPATKLMDWAKTEGLNAAALETQIKRILWEVQTGTQFSKPGESFIVWAGSEMTPEQAADDFVRYYERPAVVNSTTRQQFARQWFNALSNIAPSTPPAAPATAPSTLVIDGDRGVLTIERWQSVMGTPVDGTIDATGSALIKADQTFLNQVLHPQDIKNLTGAPKLAVDGNEGAKTVKCRQFWLFNKYGPAVLHRKAVIGDFDGILGVNTNKLHQFALNQSHADAKRY